MTVELSLHDGDGPWSMVHDLIDRGGRVADRAQNSNIGSAKISDLKNQ